MKRALLVLVASAGTAHAQSARYPAPPPDPDADAEAQSDFWDAALEPGLARFRELVDQARRMIETRDRDPMRQAADLLAEAVKLAPDRADGWWYLGVAREGVFDWPGCADAYEHAWKLDPQLVARPPLRNRAQLDHALGVCLARAGRLDDARAHLARLAQSGDADSEIWLRLGEVYMALGRLGDAEDAIGRAAEDASISPDVHWALAVAYDRARKDADAEDEMETALRLDPSLTRVMSPAVPYLDDAEGFYYEGLAAIAASQPERAVVDFRRFATLAPKSPWKARADQHLVDLGTTDWPMRMEIAGNAAIDRKKAFAALAKGWPQIQACAAGHPGLLARVSITMLGPSAAGPVVGAPPPGTRANAILAFDEDDAALEKALSCIEDQAGRLALPKPTQPNGFARLVFPVVAK
ncbi:MAG TPA: tetratricopeptide repeat protein [Kofleriaceae bacterium]|nr:tetratricopeptide repeat protein [Kofleriaceae bacterium]